MKSMLAQDPNEYYLIRNNKIDCADKTSFRTLRQY